MQLQFTFPQDSQQEIPYGYCHCGCGQKTRIISQTSNKDGRIKGQPNRFVRGHYPRENRPRIPLEDRLWARVNRPTPDACWEWMGAKNPLGYGIIGRGDKKKRNIFTHRVAYELHYGPIPEGKEIDHLCRNPSCCNPRHLEAVTHRENMLRSMSPMIQLHREKRCLRGHLLTPDNVYGKRKRCRICSLEHCRKDYAAKSTRPPRNKVTEIDVIEIRQRAQRGESHASIARHYHVGNNTVGRIVARKTWKHVG